MRQIPRLLLLVFISSILLHVTASVTWACEGRVCSLSATCCCRAKSGRDSQCSPQPEAKDASCAGKCGCILQIEDCSHHSAVVQSATVAPFPPVVLPALSDLYFSTTPKAVAVRGIEIRGPPVKAVPLFTPALRAPPSSRFTPTFV